MYAKKRTLIRRFAAGISGLLVTLTAFVSAVSPVLAQEEQKKVAVFVFPASDAEVKPALLMSRVLRANTAELTNVDLVSPSPVPGREALPELQKQIEDAYQKLSLKQVDEALKILSQIRPTLDQILPAVPLRTVALFYKAYGVALVLLGNTLDGKKGIERSLILWKEQSNLEYAYSVDVLKIYSQLSDNISRRQNGTLRVSTEPAMAAVNVDGREAVESPAVVKNLVAGPHLVKVSLDGYVQWAGFVIVPPGGTKELHVPLKPIPDKAQFDKRILALVPKIKLSVEEAAGAVLALKQFLGVDELLILQCGVAGESFELKGFHAKSDDSIVPVSRSIARDATFYAGVREFLSGLLESFYEIKAKKEGLGGPPLDPKVLEAAGVSLDQAGAVFDPDHPVFPKVDLAKKEKEPLTKKPWFWAAVGAGSVVAILATLQLTGIAPIFNPESAKVPTGSIEIEVQTLP